MIVALGLFAGVIAVALTGLLITTIGPGGDGTKDRDGESSPAATPVTVASRSQAPPPGRPALGRPTPWPPTPGGPAPRRPSRGPNATGGPSTT